MSDKDVRTGKFAKGNRGGPGRGKKGEALDRFRRDTLEETAKALAESLGELEAEIAALDGELAEAEDAYLEAIEPLLKARARLDVDISRARVSVEYLRNAHAFHGMAPDRRQEALAKFRDAREALAEAQKRLVENPDPTGNRTRAEMAVSYDAFAALKRYEDARDDVRRLSGELLAAQRACEKLGVPTEDFVPIRPFERKQRGMSIKREMMEI